MADGDRLGVVGTIERWLAQGRDVVLRGERGAGKTTALQMLLSDLSGRRLPGVLVRASAATPFSALLDHPAVTVRAPDEHALTAWLAAELGAPRSVLLVDDVDRLDPGSVRVVQRALVRTGSRLVASTTTSLLHGPGDGARQLLVARVPAEVRIPQLGMNALSTLVTEMLDAPGDASLTATLLAQSGGNPGVAVALLHAARTAGVLRMAEGRYVDDGHLVEVPAAAVAAQFLSAMDDTWVDALELLAVLGPVPRDVAQRIIDPDVLEALAERRRVVDDDAQEASLVVAPPALARALRDGVPPARRRRLVAHARDLAGEAVGGPEPAPTDLGALLARQGAGDVEFLRWSTQVAAVVHERAAAAEAEAHAAWLAHATVRHANAYLARLMRRPAADQIATVFRETTRSPQDTDDDVVTFRYYRTRWEGWLGSSDHDDTPAGGPGDDDQRALPSLDDFKQRLVVAIRDGRPAQDVADERSPPTSPSFRGVPDVLRAAALLEAGRPDLALEVCDRAAPADGFSGDIGAEVQHYLAALRGDSLALLGRLEEAEQHERTRLSAAYDAYDALGIRVHTTVLAGVLCFSGELESAWRVLSTALRLGPAGPVETTYYRRGLSIGAVLQVAAGNVDMGRVLLRELEKTPKIYRPMIRSLRVVGASAAALATGDHVGATEISWAAGQSYADAGLLEPALLTWAMGPPALTRERAQVVRAARSRVVLPMLDPYLDLQIAIAERDRSAAVQALERVEVRVAFALANHATALFDLEGPAAPIPEAPVPLTEREREIAALGRDGLSNRQIADQLHLSVRTVENHMSRALRKLGHRSRSDLRRRS